MLGEPRGNHDWCRGLLRFGKLLHMVSWRWGILFGLMPLLAEVPLRPLLSVEDMMIVVGV